jgi:UV excision repair protein RAD23
VVSSLTENNPIVVLAGKILTDESSVSELDIDDKKFIVCLVTKPKAAPLSVVPSDPTQTASASGTDSR